MNHKNSISIVVVLAVAILSVAGAFQYASADIGTRGHELQITSVSYSGGVLTYTVETDCEYGFVQILDTSGNVVSMGTSPDFNSKPYTQSFNVSLSVGSYVLEVQGCDDVSDTRAFTVSGGSASTSVTSVSLSKTAIGLSVGGSQTLTATVYPSNATNKSVSWTSSNPAVATVSSLGLVEAKSAGTAVITATTSDGGYTASCTVTVESGSLRFTSSTYTVTAGLTISVGIDVAGYTSEKIGYEIGNESIAKVKGLSIGNGVSSDGFVIQGVSPGYTTLKMYVVGNESNYVSCGITVQEATGDACTRYYFFIKFEEGDTSGSGMPSTDARAGFWVAGNGSSASAALSDAASSNGWQLSFDETYFSGWLDKFMGLSTVKNSNGTYTYWVQYHWNGSTWAYNDYALGYLKTTDYQYIAMIYSTTSVEGTGSKNLGVSPSDIPKSLIPSTGILPDSITLNRTSVSIATGYESTLTATILPSTATDGNVYWSTSDSSVATVTAGKIIAVSAGTATITATTANGKTATCVVTVVASKESTVLPSGETKNDDGTTTIREEGTKIVSDDGTIVTVTPTKIKDASGNTISESTVTVTTKTDGSSETTEEGTKTIGGIKVQFVRTEVVAANSTSSSVSAQVSDESLGITTTAQTKTVGGTGESSIKTSIAVSDGASISYDMANVAVEQLNAVRSVTGISKASEITIVGASNASTVSIDAEAASVISDAGISVSISSLSGSISVGSEVISEASSGGDITIVIDVAAGLSSAQTEKIGSNGSAVDVKLSCSSGKTEFTGKIVIGIPYALKDGEDPKYVSMWYFKDDGSIQSIDCWYENGMAYTEVNHLSVYAVGYEEPSSDDDSILPYAAIAVVAIAAISVALVLMLRKP